MDISSSAHTNLLFTCFLVLSFSLLSFSLDQKTYIVRVDHESMPSVFPTPSHWYESSLASLASDFQTLDPLLSSKQNDNVAASTGRIIYTYDAVLHGFSARLSSEEVRKLETINGVLAVIPEQVRHLQTTHSPKFMGLKRGDNGGLLKESNYGENVIIGIIDSGIWPEKESFHDRGLGPVPSKWKGKCVVESDFPAGLCNRKIIGARYFSEGLVFGDDLINATSPRDYDGHGTSTASIAAGRYVSSASMFGYAEGVATGMAPKARLAIYKACWIPNQCADAHLLAAFDAAVADGVDIISLSLSSEVFPFSDDLMAIGAFAASDAGIFVSASAGNNGPYGIYDNSARNSAPWFTTVRDQWTEIFQHFLGLEPVKDVGTITKNKINVSVGV